MQGKDMHVIAKWNDYGENSPSPRTRTLQSGLNKRCETVEKIYDTCECSVADGGSTSCNEVCAMRMRTSPTRHLCDCGRHDNQFDESSTSSGLTSSSFISFSVFHISYTLHPLSLNFPSSHAIPILPSSPSSSSSSSSSSSYSFLPLENVSRTRRAPVLNPATLTSSSAFLSASSRSCLCSGEVTKESRNGELLRGCSQASERASNVGKPRSPCPICRNKSSSSVKCRDPRSRRQGDIVSPRSFADTCRVRLHKNTDVAAKSRRKGKAQMDRHLLRTAVTMILMMIASSASASTYELKPTTILSKVTLADLKVKLPCELPSTSDRPTLILWYKNKDTSPFYSFDARDNAAGHHKVHNQSELGSRAHFVLEAYSQKMKVNLGFLEVEKVTLDDAGNYTCRVDFQSSQTMMSLLKLTVHEKIKSLEIFDNYETMVGKVVGPYEQSARVMLTCRAFGGYPTPVVKWMSGDEVLKTSSSQQYTPIRLGDGYVQGGSFQKVVSVVLHLPGLRREDNGREVKCVASNTNLTEALIRAVTITMFLPPLEVRVEGVDKPLRAGREAILVCKSAGSRPPASLTWSLEGSSGLTPLPAQSSLDQNTTIRRGRLLPTPDDNGRSLTCTATNPRVEDYILATTHTLSVHFAPEVVARLAPALDPGNIKEGEDVYFECEIRANPEVTRVLWLHEGEVLHSDRARGVFDQSRNLVLQKVSRHARGSYQCTVTNVIDTVTSAPATLNVMFVPECRGPRNVTVSVTPTEEVTLNCAVESNPEEVTFMWKVNGSRGVKELDSALYTSRGRTSSLKYRPSDHVITQDQYGVVFCLASNKLGTQKLPCMFTISPAGPPEQPELCRLVNQSATSLGVTCLPGHNGGLPQHFVATVQDASTRKVVANVSSEKPDFSVYDLPPARDYLVVIIAANKKGVSQPYTLEGFGLKVAENKINNSSSSESSPLLAVFIGVVSGFVFIVTVLVVATRAGCRRRRRHPDVALENTKLGDGEEGEIPLSPSANASAEGASEGEDLNPLDPQSPHLETLEVSAQSPESPTTRTYIPGPGGGSHSSTLPRSLNPLHNRPQPLHSVDLPHVTSNNHKYYTLKINCTRQNNESFV